VKLFEPYSINSKLQLRNRTILPAIVTRLATENGEVTDDLLERYELYARGGVGMIVTEAVSVKKQKSGPLLRISDDSFVDGLKSLTARVHAVSDAKVGPQLIHFLKLSRSGYRQKVEDLPIEEVKEIPRLFGEAAYRARQAGFDMIELHFAHAYTMSSFLSRHNHRKDDYGGSLKKRLRLAEEVIAETRKSVGDDFVIGARMNGDEFTLGGSSLKQTKVIATRLAELGLDYLSVSAGGKFEDAVQREGRALEPYTTGYSGSRAIPPAWTPEKVNVYLCKAIRDTLRAKGHPLPVATAARIPNAQVAQGILDGNEADLVAIARPILCDPYWPNKHASGRESDVLKCTYCNKCAELDAAHQKVFCVQWKTRDGEYRPPRP
jgi:2,4-dienoyl-CoA reductase-like NADH-dependent reductase (Old Yellow Enzyme family)